MFKLIIFDCDGVLVDSEKIANEVFSEVLNRECGLNLSLEDMFNTFVGHSSKQCMQIITEMLGKEPPKNLEQLYKSEINTALAKKVTAVSGIEGVLKMLFEEFKIPFCVASSGSHEKMRATLGKTNLLKYFRPGTIFSSSDVKNGKPSPDLYLHAAKQMGDFKSNECLVIEDSPLGVKGSKNAGMTVYAYCDLMEPEKSLKAGADLILNDMNELKNILSKKIIRTSS